MRHCGHALHRHGSDAIAGKVHLFDRHGCLLCGAGNSYLGRSTLSDISVPRRFTLMGLAKGRQRSDYGCGHPSDALHRHGCGELYSNASRSRATWEYHQHPADWHCGHDSHRVDGADASDLAVAGGQALLGRATAARRLHGQHPGKCLFQGSEEPVCAHQPEDGQRDRVDQGISSSGQVRLRLLQLSPC